MGAFRQAWPYAFGLFAVVAALAGITVWSILADRPKTWRGVVHCPMMAIGGETTGVVLEAPSQWYELDLSALPKWSTSGRQATLNDRTVTVTGHLTVRQGIEIRERRIIRVVDLKLED